MLQIFWLQPFVVAIRTMSFFECQYNMLNIIINMYTEIIKCIKGKLFERFINSLQSFLVFSVSLQTSAHTEPSSYFSHKPKRQCSDLDSAVLLRSRTSPVQRAAAQCRAGINYNTLSLTCHS